MAEHRDLVDEEGERKDAELFEENLADGVWIPLGFAWDSPAEIRSRAKDLEEDAEDNLEAPSPEHDEEEGERQGG